MHRKNKLFLVIAVVIAAMEFGLCAKAAPITLHTTDSLWKKLKSAETSADSITILYNLYDVNSALQSRHNGRYANKKILNKLVKAAENAGDSMALFDAVRNLATLERYDIGLIDEQLKAIKKYPPSREKRETETYLLLQRHASVLRDTTLTDAQRRQNFSRLNKELQQLKNSKSIYDKLNVQFAMMLYGENLTQPDQMKGYLEELSKMVDRTHGYRSAIKSFYYYIAAMIYDENQEWTHSVEADRKMLSILDSLSVVDNKRGRIYKNYDRTYFTSYRRMLSNYEYLRKGEPEALYNKLQELLTTLPKDQVTQFEKLSIEAMWNMYRHKYPEALKQLRTILTSKRYKQKPNYILAYIKAATATNSMEDLQRGQQLYIDLILNRAQDAADTEYARISSEVGLTELKDSLDIASRSAIQARERAQEAIKSNEYTRHWLLTYGLAIAGAFLLIVVVLLVLANLRTRRMAERLDDANKQLTSERDSLRRAKSDLMAARDSLSKAMKQKTEFIHDFSHEIVEPVKAIVGFTQLIVDSVPEERRRYLNSFLEIIESNSQILQRLAYDILETAEIDGTVINVEVSHFDPEEICSLVADNFRPRLNPNQNLVVEPMRIIGHSPDNTKGIDSDSLRLEQILTNIVSNAVKFCETGDIVISPELNFDSQTLTIAVSDQGPGIPKGKEEQIFKRFERLGHYRDGLGLGLYVSRELAHVIDGDIHLDTNYHSGTRMVITVPINLRKA